MGGHSTNFVNLILAKKLLVVKIHFIVKINIIMNENYIYMSRI